MKLTNDLIGKKIIRTKEVSPGDKSFMISPREVFDIGRVHFFLLDQDNPQRWQPYPYKLSKYDDGNWELYHECKHKCPFFSKPKFCPECGEKISDRG